MCPGCYPGMDNATPACAAMQQMCREILENVTSFQSQVHSHLPQGWISTKLWSLPDDPPVMTADGQNTRNVPLGKHNIIGYLNLHPTQTTELVLNLINDLMETLFIMNLW